MVYWRQDFRTFLVYISLLHLFILELVESDCPRYFSCEDLGDLEFPLSTHRQPECGLVKVDCDSRPFPKIYLENELVPTKEILRKISNNSLFIQNSRIISENESQRCNVFGYSSWPNSPSISFSIFPNISVFICGKSVTLPELPRYRDYEGCADFNVYYIIPNDAPPPPGCSSLILPFNTSSNSSDFFDLLSTRYELGWTVSDKCIDCHRKGGYCTTHPENEFRCENGNYTFLKADQGGKSKVKLIVLLTVISGSIALCGVGFLVWFPRRRIKNAYLLPRNISGILQNNHNIEVFLEKYRNLAPIRYKYSNLKKITNSFSNKLGEGGFASVYKGNLPERHVVAVKILKESKGNGEEFINEVASISRTSHVNIVSLLGFCFEGSKRALIYEFMPNGSLEKFIYSNSSIEKCQLGWEKLFQIAVGIARGIEYLHQGCNMRILHFDIKPHNILLDKDFNPKVSDFGLAKLCPNRSSIVSILGARGTIGYIAPELVCRNIGEVSNKSDVYSYGMMILEMVGERKNIDVGVDRTSEIYFPHWIYRHLEQNVELNLSRVSDEDEQLTIRKMTIVGLWCIQTDPTIRPPMNKVVEMLEGNMESLQIPPKPYLSSPPRQEQTSSTSESILGSLL